MSVKELLEELDTKTKAMGAELGHLVSWQKFERASAVVTELEKELETLGLPVGPVESLTQALVGVVDAIHSHLTAGQVEQEREEITAQIAELQARLDKAPPPAPAADPVTPDPAAPAAPAVKGGTGG